MEDLYLCRAQIAEGSFIFPEMLKWFIQKGKQRVRLGHTQNRTPAANWKAG